MDFCIIAYSGNTKYDNQIRALANTWGYHPWYIEFRQR